MTNGAAAFGEISNILVNMKWHLIMQYGGILDATIHDFNGLNNCIMSSTRKYNETLFDSPKLFNVVIIHRS